MKIDLSEEERKLVKEALTVTSVRYEYISTNKELKKSITEKSADEFLKVSDKMLKLANKIIALENQDKDVK